MNTVAVTAPEGYEATDSRYGQYPTVEFKSVEFGRSPSITLQTVERSVLLDGQYITRRFWQVSTGSVGAMERRALQDYINALLHAQKLCEDLRALEVEATPLEVQRAFEEQGKVA